MSFSPEWIRIRKMERLDPGPTGRNRTANESVRTQTKGNGPLGSGPKETVSGTNEMDSKSLKSAGQVFCFGWVEKKCCFCRNGNISSSLFDRHVCR
ncbi:hypothetical protein AVEN_147247-1 [Araneus ventricosus]|uniref:Uncharacterized protein n=1 Tax=Araneus ventricosus TaxID=182803 RepID=A0A4Y2R396_ARAVE|nr:hypothetical protein AVEN_147247-1 [Araneus ventricosus]